MDFTALDKEPGATVPSPLPTELVTACKYFRLQNLNKDCSQNGKLALDILGTDSLVAKVKIAYLPVDKLAAKSLGIRKRLISMKTESEIENWLVCTSGEVFLASKSQICILF